MVRKPRVIEVLERYVARDSRGRVVRCAGEGGPGKLVFASEPDVVAAVRDARALGEALRWFECDRGAHWHVKARGSLVESWSPTQRRRLQRARAAERAATSEGS